jgi:hypothetical protein
VQQENANAMHRIVRRALTAAALFILSTSAHAQKTPALNLERNSLAVQGYDVVAYGAQSAAVRGRAE